MRKRIDDPSYTTAVIPTNTLAVLERVAQQLGEKTDGWYLGLGLQPGQLGCPETRVSYRQASQIIRRAQRQLVRPDLGLLVGSTQTVSSLGILGLAMMTSKTLGMALQLFLENVGSAGTLVAPDVRIDENTFALIARPQFPDDELQPFLCEEFYASSLSMSRHLVGEAFQPLRLDLAYPRPAHHQAYADYFKCEIRFDQPETQAIVDLDWLSSELPAYNPLSSQQALAACRSQIVAQLPGSEFIRSVERWLNERLRDRPRLADIALDMNQAERTLRRKLTEAGTSFNAIHDRIRTERALELLRQERLSVTDIGSSLGFSDVREFRRAFKRWTGMAPSQARDSLA